jgi:hypothetical protein
MALSEIPILEPPTSPRIASKDSERRRSISDEPLSTGDENVAEDTGLYI